MRFETDGWVYNRFEQYPYEIYHVQTGLLELRQQKENEAAEKHKDNAVRDTQIRDLFEKAKVMENMITDLTSQLVKLLKEIE